MRELIKRYFKISLATRILIWMVIGVVIGWLMKEQAEIFKPLGDVFIKLLLMAAIPLVFFNLLAGLTAMGDVKTFGKVGIKVLAFYLVTTSMAMAVGIVIMSWLRAGEGMTLSETPPENIGAMPNLGDLFMEMIPSNIFESFANGNLVQIVIFAVILGIVTLMMPEDKKSKLEKGYQLLAELMRKMVDVIMYLAPVCLGALAAYTVGIYGAQIFGPLAKFIGGIYLAQFLMVCFYMFLLLGLSKTSPIWFLKKTAPLYATTVATCSSLASLVVSMNIAGKKLKLPESIYSFTLPLGAQFNKDGTSIMLTGVLIFTAQATSVHFDLPELLQIILVGLILVEGSGGIPGGGLVVAMIFAQAFNLPLEIVAIVGGIYRLIDMGNTTVNCMGDMVATTIISRMDRGWRPEYD